MTIFLTLPDGFGHVGYFLNRYGRRHSRVMTDITYADFLRRDCFPRAVYIFCDRERMSERQRQTAVQLWDRVGQSGSAIRLLNDPRKQLSRYELLRNLAIDGTNEFNVYRPNELEQARFPVFVRIENDHSGPKTDLINDQSSLLRELARLTLAGLDPKHLLISEFVDTRDSDGFYRKFGAYRIGDLIFGHHVLVGTNWANKAEQRLKTEEALGENRDYYSENPHAGMLMPFFERAGIEYGRVDYSFKNGRIQIWEINDNPRFASPNPQYINKQGKELTYVAGLEALSK